MKINGGIKSPSVRLIDGNNNQVGIVDIASAMTMANDAGMDLVEVSPNSAPPVCRLMDYGKWLYEQKRKVRDAHKKNVRHVSTLKEIRLRPETDKRDIEIKVAHGREFLEKGHKVQFILFFRGRQMLHREQGYEVLEQIAQSLDDVAKVEQSARMTGRRLSIMLVSKKQVVVAQDRKVVAEPEPEEAGDSLEIG
jgi:translation initiation factor IF-3